MVALISINIAAEELHYYPTPENLERRKEFADAKFGIFIHWGIYSMMGDGEWVEVQFSKKLRTLLPYKYMEEYMSKLYLNYE